MTALTKGAMYHHFRDKDELFRSVVEDVKREVTVVAGRSFAAAADGPDSLETVVLGCMAFIDAFADPAAQRIAISDARAVLDDMETARQHSRSVVGRLVEGLRAPA